MTTYLTPGVYIQEVERGPQPIQGVPTNIVAFLGETERGPTYPRLISSYNDYARFFGSVYDDTKFMPYVVSGFFDNEGTTAYICRIVPRDAKPAYHVYGGYRVTALGPGTWGKNVFIKFTNSTTQSYVVPAGGGAPAAQPIGIHMQLAYWEANTLGQAAPYDPWNPAAIPPNAPTPDYTEDFDDVVLDDPADPNYYTKRLGIGVNSNSSFVMFAPDVAAANPPATPVGISSVLDQDGTNAAAAPTVVDYNGNVDSAGNTITDPSQMTGLAALLLDEFRDVSLVYAPNTGAAADITSSIINHCQYQSGYRLAVIDAPEGQSNYQTLTPRGMSANSDTSYAAYYYPWIWISDPVTGKLIKVPPGGHVLGVYARTDDTRGVFKAPANEIVDGALDLEYDISDNTQSVLNPAGVNVIRKFPTRGIRIWGARTLASDALWKYVNVRRLFIFLERSIYEGTQWVVFEPNDQRLWARVVDTVRLFLRQQWRQGALMGATEDQAFQIACDQSTMTPEDILNGMLICQVGIAPVRPAEFVIFQIYQATADAQS
jgi:phage tail sheath protein FI